MSFKEGDFILIENGYFWTWIDDSYEQIDLPELTSAFILEIDRFGYKIFISTNGLIGSLDNHISCKLVKDYGNKTR